MNTIRTTTPSRLVNRALLLPVGAGAEKLAARVCDLSQEWLQGDAPAAVVEPDLTAEEVALVLDQLAGQGLVQSLRERGMDLARRNEMELWALIDLTGDAPGVAPEQVYENVQALVEMAWKRLRIQVAVYGLLLAAPAGQTALKPWTDALAPLWENRLSLVGPVNRSHLCLDESAWQERAATGLAALLWSKAPSHSHLGQGHTQKPTPIALGATVWIAPRNRLNEWLSLHFVQGAVRRLLLEEPGAGEERAQSRASTAEQMQGLVKKLSGPPAPRRWGDRRPGLTALVELPETLVGEAERAQKEHVMKAQQGRRRWLQEQMEAWAGSLQEDRRAYLAPTEGWPQLAEYRRWLEARHRKMMAQLPLVESELEGWGERIEQAERATRQAQTELTELCAYFPTPDLRGGLTVLTRPWRLVSWLWAYLHWLPQRAQQLLDGLTRQAEARWQEANWHSLRQFYLAQAQEFRLALDEAEQLGRRLEEMDGRTASRLEGLPMTELHPWTPAGLENLYSRLLADGGACTLAFLSEHPLTEWLEEGTERVESALLAWPTAWLQPLERWTGSDHLVEALPGSALAGWLHEEGQLALPLWPDQALESDGQTENRLLLGAWSQHPEGNDPGHGERLERLQAAAAEALAPVDSSFYGDGVALLRLVVVDLEAEAEAEEEEVDT